MPGRGCGVSVHVQAEYREHGGVTPGQILHHGREFRAGHARWRPEVHQRRAPARQGLCVEVRGAERGDSGGDGQLVISTGMPTLTSS